MDQAPLDDSKKTGEEGEDKAIHDEALQRYKICKDFWEPIQKEWIEDAKFRALDQWPAEIKSKRDLAKRPVLTVDKCNQYVRQVVNDGRQNRPAVKIRPIDDDGDVEIAEALQGIVRHICDRSNADEAFDTSLDHAAGNGYGFIRVLTDYAHKDTFNQEIQIARIRNPIGAMIDPNFATADGSDAKFGFVEDELPKEVFKKRYPKAKFVDWKSDTSKYSDGWINGDNVRYVEYYYTVETDRDMHLLADSTTISDEDYQRAIAEGITPPAIVDTRNIPSCEVKWCRLSGAEILEKRDWKGVYVPLIPVFGNESDIDGKVMYSGLIRAAKDAQRLYNFMRSAYAERVALTPKAPWVAAEGQMEGHEEEWKDANTEPVSVLVYKEISVDGNSVPPPQRVNASDVPSGFAQDMQLSEHDIQAAMGMYNASLGEKSNEKSGKAIMARQREGDTATFHYQDNLNRAIRYLGRILVDLIPKIYDSKRVVRILGEDGSAEAAEIDPRQEAPVQRMGGKVIYNLNVGTYDVSVAAGPSYTTKRQEAAEAQMQLVQSAPEVFQIIGDIIVKNMDWPGADDIADRLKIMLPPPIQSALQAKEQGQDPKIEAAIAPLKMGLEQAQQQIQAAEAGIAERDAELKRLTDELAAEKADKSLEFEKLELERMKTEAEINKPEPITPDNSGVEFAKIEADKWKAQLEADTKVIVEAIKARGATEQASIGAQAQQVEREQQAAQEAIPEAPEIDTSAAIIAALQSFTEAVTRPRTAVMPDGRRITVQ
jgi:hypothetical protein